jgi:DNA-directed RNA polymerase subunit N (RpoN/RPB10)
MLIPVQCFTCGEILGDKWERFKELSEIVKNCIRISAIGKLYPQYLSDEIKNGKYDYLVQRPSDGILLAPNIINTIIGECFKNISIEENGKEIIDNINQFMIEEGEVDNLKRTPERVALDSLNIKRMCCRTIMLGTSEIALQD